MSRRFVQCGQCGVTRFPVHNLFLLLPMTTNFNWNRRSTPFAFATHSLFVASIQSYARCLTISAIWLVSMCLSHWQCIINAETFTFKIYEWIVLEAFHGLHSEKIYSIWDYTDKSVYLLEKKVSLNKVFCFYRKWSMEICGLFEIIESSRRMHRCTCVCWFSCNCNSYEIIVVI